MPRQHRLDRRRVTLRQPKPLRVFVHDENIPIAVATTEQDDGVMSIPIIQCREPFNRPRIVEILDDNQAADVCWKQTNKVGEFAALLAGACQPGLDLVTIAQTASK